MRREGRRRQDSRASPLEEFLREAGRGLFSGAGARVSSRIGGLLRGAGRRFALTGAGLAALMLGAAFLLLAGAHALRAAGVPPSIAYLVMGLLGAVAGLALTKLR